MPKGDPFDEYFNDPDFRKLAGPDKIAVLSHVDPEFAQLPIREQATVVQAYLSTPPAEGKGALETAADVLGGGVMSLVHPIETLKGDQPARAEQQRKANEAFQQGHYPEAFGHRFAASLPFIGPMAAQAGEDIGEGRTAQGLTETGMALAPSAIGALRDVPLSRVGEAHREGVRTAAQRPWGDWRSRTALAAPLELGLEWMGAPRGVGFGIDATTMAAPKVAGYGRGFIQNLTQQPFGPEFQATPPPAPLRGPIWGGPSPAPTEPIGPINPIPSQWTPRESPFPKINPNFKSAQPPPEATLSQPIVVHDIGSISSGFKPMGESSLVPHTQLDLPLKDAPTSSQRIGMHHIIQFANDNAIPFQDAYKAFAREGYIGDWNSMGP